MQQFTLAERQVVAIVPDRPVPADAVQISAVVGEILRIGRPRPELVQAQERG